MSMFVKLFNQILDSSIADDRRLRHFFTDLLLCADSKGFVLMTESAIARRIGATLEEVQWGIEELCKPDPRSKTPDVDGRRIEPLKGHGYGWRIINFEAYRALRDADQMREATRNRVRRFRERKKATGNGDVTQSNDGNAIKKEKENKRESKKEKKDKDSAVGAEVVALWNSFDDFAKVKAVSANRAAHLRARLAEPYFADEYPNAMRKMAASPFLLGENDRGWRADFDWFLKPDSVARIMEGKYDSKTTPSKPSAEIPQEDGIGGRKGTFTHID